MAKKAAVIKKEKAKPTETALAKEQQKVITEAVYFINDKANSMVKPLFEIGQYLLQHFYKNDPAQFRSKDPTKDQSLQALVDHPDLQMSHTSLYNAIELAIRGTSLQEKKYAALTDSHKILLCKIDDDEEKLKYADHAVKEKLSVRGLRSLLKEKEAISLPGRRKGSTSSDGESKAYQSIFEPVELIENLTLDTIDFETLTPENITSLEDAIKKAKSKLDACLKKLKESQKTES